MDETQLLAQLRQAKIDLISGRMPSVFVDQNGERVEYSKASLSALDAEIRRLEVATNPAARHGAAGRAIGFTF